MSIQVRNPAGGYVVASTSGTGTNYIDASALTTIGTYSVQITPDPSFSGSLSLTASSVPVDVTDRSRRAPPAARRRSTSRRPAPMAGSPSRAWPIGACSSASRRRRRRRLGRAARLQRRAAGRHVDRQDRHVHRHRAAALEPGERHLHGARRPVRHQRRVDHRDGVRPRRVRPARPAIASLPGTQTVTTSSPGVNGGITFPAVAGHKVSVKMAGSTFATVSLRLLNPDASQLGLAASYRAATGFVDALESPRPAPTSWSSTRPASARAPPASRSTTSRPTPAAA